MDVGEVVIRRLLNAISVAKDLQNFLIDGQWKLQGAAGSAAVLQEDVASIRFRCCSIGEVLGKDKAANSHILTSRAKPKHTGGISRGSLGSATPAHLKASISKKSTDGSLFGAGNQYASPTEPFAMPVAASSWFVITAADGAFVVSAAAADAYSDIAGCLLSVFSRFSRSASFICSAAKSSAVGTDAWPSE